MNRDSSFSESFRRRDCTWANPLVQTVLIFLVCIISYSNTFHVPFQFDDPYNISGKPYVKDIRTFLGSTPVEKDSSFIMRTVTYFTFALNYRLHGDGVVGYHVVNLSIHIINGFLVYFLVLLTFKTPFAAAAGMSFPLVGNPSEERLRTSRSDKQNLVPLFAALLFTCHPIQTQAVTYIVQRLASLATLFYLLSLVLYVVWRLRWGGTRTKGNKNESASLVFYVLSFLAATIAMKTKEIAFTLPLVITLYEMLFFEGPLKRRLLFLAPFLLTMFIIPAGLMEITKSAGEVIGDVSEATKIGSALTRGEYLFTEFRVIVTYIRLLFFPVNQNLDYDYPVYHSFFDPNVVLSFLFLLGIAGTGVYLLHRSRIILQASYTGGKVTPLPSAPPRKIGGGRGSYDAGDPEAIAAVYFRLTAFGIFWFFMTLSVESSIIPITDVIFEHRLYLPSVGFFIGVAAVLYMVWQRVNGLRRTPAGIGMAVCGLIIVVLTGTTYARNNQWKDEVRLWEDVVKKSPSKVRPRINLGYFYGKQGRLEEAVREYQTALRLDPNDFQVRDNLGVIYKAQGLIDEAIRQYRTALALNPRDAMAHYNLGNIFRERGDFKEAIRQYQNALRLEPETEVAVIHNNLGISYASVGNVKEAEREFRIAIGLDPDYEAAGRNLEMLLRGGGR